MTSGPVLDRRGFLALLVAGAAVTAASACSGDGDDGEGGGDGTTVAPPSAPEPDSLAEALVVLAAAVRAVAPDLEPLTLDVDPSDPARLTDAVAALDESARADLAAGDTVLVAGWVLSTTEARLCLAAA